MTSSKTPYGVRSYSVLVALSPIFFATPRSPSEQQLVKLCTTIAVSREEPQHAEVERNVIINNSDLWDRLQHQTWYIASMNYILTGEKRKFVTPAEI